MIRTIYGDYVWKHWDGVAWLVPAQATNNMVGLVSVFYATLNFFVPPMSTNATKVMFAPLTASIEDNKVTAVYWLVENGIIDPLCLLPEDE